MAKWSQRSYWKVVNGVRDQFDLSLAEAREAYRQLKDRLGRSVFGTDLAKHPRIVREEVRDARLSLVRAVETPEPRERIRKQEEYYDDLLAEDFGEFEFTADTEGGT